MTVILPIVIIVPALLVGIGLYAAISKMGVIPDLAGDPSRPLRRDRFVGDYDEDTLWPVRQVQRVPQPVLVGLVAVMAVWVLAWVVIFIAGLAVMSV